MGAVHSFLMTQKGRQNLRSLGQKIVIAFWHPWCDGCCSKGVGEGADVSLQPAASQEPPVDDGANGDELLEMDSQRNHE